MRKLLQRLARPFSRRLQQRIDTAVRRAEDRLDRLELVTTQESDEVQGRLDELGRELGAIREEVGGEIGTLREEMGGEIGALREERGREFDALSQELKQEVGALRAEVDSMNCYLPLLVTALARRTAAREAASLQDGAEGADAGPLRVAIYAGIYLPADGISASVRPKVEMIRALGRAGVPIRVTVFTQISDEAADPEVITTTSLEKLLGRREFEEADLHLFEFGHFFELFDATLAVPETALIAAVYHNITPVELSHDLEFQRRIRRSLAQKHNLFLADRILCVSEFNRDDLLGFGIPADRLTVLATPPAVVPLQHEAAAGETVELLFVGRIIPAKGVLDLVQALAEVVQGGVTEVRLTVAGNVALSSADCLHEIRELVKTGGLEDHVRIVHPDDEELGRLYARSDALVMPSYHEGFCVPVVEALSAQCHVIASDAGNLPRTVGGLGTLVPAGDVTALARAIADFAGRVLTARRSGEQMAVPTANGPIPEDVWRRRTADHVAQYSRQAFERGFAEFLAWAAQRSGREAVAEAIRRWPV